MSTAAIRLRGEQRTYDEVKRLRRASLLNCGERDPSAGMNRPDGYPAAAASASAASRSERRSSSLAIVRR